MDWKGPAKEQGCERRFVRGVCERARDSLCCNFRRLCLDIWVFRRPRLEIWVVLAPRAARIGCVEQCWLQ